MDRWKSREESEKSKRKKKEDVGARKGKKGAKHCVFPMLCGSGGSKSRLAKAASAEQMRDEKLHAVVAWSTFRSQNGKSTTCSAQFWKLRRSKSAKRGGAKYVSKSKGSKHTTFGALLEVAMWKRCKTLSREARFQVNMYQMLQVRSTFGRWDVEKVRAVVGRSTFRSQTF